jgi:hypothetical protein
VPLWTVTLTIVDAGVAPPWLAEKVTVLAERE